MPKQATTEGFEDGVEGAGSKWQSRVEEAAEEGRYGTGDDGQSNYEDNAGSSEADADYKQNVAESFGLDPDDIEPAPSDGIDSDTGDEWSNGVRGASQRWADGVQDVSASDWESETKDASSDWLQNTKEGLQDN